MIFKIKMHLFDLWPRYDLDSNFPRRDIHPGAVCYIAQDNSSIDAEH